MTPLFIALGVLALLVVFVWLTYNSLVTLRERIKEARSGIEVQLKRRADLIPNLVETVKGYAKHEKEVFENVTKARSALMSAGSMGEKAKADNMLEQSGYNALTADDIYYLTSLAKFDDRFVIPASHREQAIEMLEFTGDVKGSVGFGFIEKPARGI